MLTGKALMSRREFWHKHLFLKQMLPCQSAEEKPMEMEQWIILGTRRDRAILEGFQTLFLAVLKQKCRCVLRQWILGVILGVTEGIKQRHVMYRGRWQRVGGHWCLLHTERLRIHVNSVACLLFLLVYVPQALWYTHTWTCGYCRLPGLQI